MIKVLITDDHPVVRQGIKQILEEDERMELVEEASSGKELFEKLNNKEFDVVLLDISLPGRNGLELLGDIKRLKPEIPVVMLTIYSEEQYALRALKLGASGYLAKTSAPDELIVAVVKAAGGGRYISSSLADKITLDFFDKKERPLQEKLSVREMEVISLLSSGKRISSIAKELSLSPKTISTYRERILTKLKLKTTSDIIRYAIKSGLADES